MIVCGAKTRSGGECGRPAGWGTDHVGAGSCKLHGGCTPGGNLSGLRKLEEARARSILERLEVPEPIDHPVYELLRLAAEGREWQRILRERLAELREALSQWDKQGIDRERAVVSLYERALERQARVLVDMAKLDLQAKAMAIQRETARELVRAVGLALERVGLGEHEEAVRTQLAQILRARSPAPALTAGESATH